MKGLSREVLTEAMAWFKVAQAANWASLGDVRKQYPSADQVGNALIFNVRHNRYLLITRVGFEKRKLYIKAFLTHKEYERQEWKKWA